MKAEAKLSGGACDACEKTWLDEGGMHGTGDERGGGRGRARGEERWVYGE